MQAIEKFSYGMYIVTALSGGKPNGCVANCAVQITAEPAIVAVSINHDNYTNKCIAETGRFAVSVLAMDSDASLIGTFGFKSGKDTDKFKNVSYKTESGLPIITDSCGYIVCKVIDTVETATHTVFLGEMIASETFGDREQMTYDYYHKTVKGRSPKNAPTYIAPEAGKPEPQPPVKKRKFVCTVCGYEYEGEDLPVGYTCPICGVDGTMFKEVIE